MQKKNTLTVSIPKIPQVTALDFARIPTLDIFQVLTMVGGSPFFSYDSYHLEMIYLKSATPSPDYKTWDFEFIDGAKFSDGSPLTATHWYHSVARAVRLGLGVHFNPREELAGAKQSKDGYCDGLYLEGNKVRLILIRPNKSLPRLIGKPEAAILPISDPKTFVLDVARMPSSGPYFISSFSEHEITLAKNPYFPAAVEGGYKSIKFVQLDDRDAFTARAKGEVDVIFPRTLPPEEMRTPLNFRSQVYRTFGSTTFLSFRLKVDRQQVEASWYTNHQFRRRLSQLLQEIPYCKDPACIGQEKASSILMGDGLGRLSAPARVSENISVADLPVLTVAAVDLPRSRHIVEFLGGSGIRVNVEWVAQFTDLYSEKALHTDAIIGWNDFAARDPYISLYNALNPARPLFYDDANGRFRKMLELAQGADDEATKNKIYQELHRSLVEEGWVAPIFSAWTDYFVDKNIDISHLIGFALWKVRPVEQSKE